MASLMGSMRPTMLLGLLGAAKMLLAMEWEEGASEAAELNGCSFEKVAVSFCSSAKIFPFTWPHKSLTTVINCVIATVRF